MEEVGSATGSVSPQTVLGSSPAVAGRPSSGSLPSTPSKQQRAAPEVEERWREVSGLKSPQEVLMGEFSCAHTGDLIVSQGRLFLSTNHLVFYSSLGNLAVKKLIMPWSNVKAIDKTSTNYEAAAGVRITMRDGDVRNFTQFVSRDKVHETLVRVWSRAPRTEESDESKPLFFEGPHAASVSAPAIPSAAIVSAPPLTASMGSVAVVSPVLPTVAASPPPLTSEQPASLNVTVCEHWVEPSTEAVGSATLPFSIEEFLLRFVDDNGAFFNMFHQEAGLGGQGDMWIKPYPKTENACCSSRDFNFQQPITTSFPLAPTTTRVKQTHRWFFPSKDMLYLSTSSMMPDIPYGSSFSIESKWKVKRSAEKEGWCDVTCHVEGNFFKWLFGFRNTVEQLIKKDGYSYVKGLLDRMVREGSERTKESAHPAPSLFREPAPKSIIKPATIRETPPRLTPPPKKVKAAKGAMQPVTLLVVFVSLVLLAICVGYLRQLSSTIHTVARPLSESVIDLLKVEVSEMRERLDTIERLLKQLKN
jgi:hypothetical protein